MAKKSSAPHSGKSTGAMDHWEVKYDPTAPSKNMKDVMGSDFNPKCSDERKTTHIKVNKQDH